MAVAAVAAAAVVVTFCFSCGLIVAVAAVLVCAKSIGCGAPQESRLRLLKDLEDVVSNQHFEEVSVVVVLEHCRRQFLQCMYSTAQ